MSGIANCNVISNDNETGVRTLEGQEHHFTMEVEIDSPCAQFSSPDSLQTTRNRSPAMNSNLITLDTRKYAADICHSNDENKSVIAQMTPIKKNLEFQFTISRN